MASCPTCGSEAFHPLANEGCCSFRCESCGTEWQYELGHLLVR